MQLTFSIKQSFVFLCSVVRMTATFTNIKVRFIGYGLELRVIILVGLRKPAAQADMAAPTMPELASVNLELTNELVKMTDCIRAKHILVPVGTKNVELTTAPPLGIQSGGSRHAFSLSDFLVYLGLPWNVGSPEFLHIQHQLVHTYSCQF